MCLSRYVVVKGCHPMNSLRFFFCRALLGRSIRPGPLWQRSYFLIVKTHYFDLWRRASGSFIAQAFFRGVPLKEFSPRTFRFEKEFSAGLKLLSIFNKSILTCNSVLASYHLDLSFASQLYERMVRMNRDIIEWEKFLFAKSLCQKTAQR